MTAYYDVTPRSFNLPKVELHTHLDGDVRSETILHFAKKRGIKLPADTVEEVRDLVTFVKTPNVPLDFSKFDFVNAAVGGCREALKRIAYEFVETKFKEGVIYVEARYSPHLFANSKVTPVVSGQIPGDVTPEDALVAVLEGFKEGEEKFGIKVRSILCCILAFPYWCDEVVELCKKYRDRGVVGIDIAGGRPPQEFFFCKEEVKAFQDAFEHGIHRTVHAGEVDSAKHVEFAVDVLKAERIGHGTKIIEDMEIYKKVVGKDVHIEVCPFSNYISDSWDYSTPHPVVKFKEDGVNYSINSDDSSMFRKGLNGNYSFLAERYGFTIDEFKRTNINAAKAAFLPEDEKKELLDKLYKAYGIQ
ncbi:adenosine/AMP deaminase domain-containing protein [Theileria equi strain WA]|uniref:adenosine deaminase n=1 Tax=Theileria equi strain WA TaxID=1537102 RepID=L0B1N8_THEEQ|nr:adenosine/AMP deaminase domain-containing protein [Theileria equi strain WA]AFZ81750.1 adenosine/AMP deaminase domain-containing protein [Theileria equi strain WA]|eukprot:XP_004831416.1 adenosine/AMP deaminase domain-containing protein [Theileria equi strain WA]